MQRAAPVVRPSRQKRLVVAGTTGSFSQSSSAPGRQVNGKVRAQIELPTGATELLAREAALANPKVAAVLEGKELKRFIYVPGRIVNIVVK